MTTTSTPFTVDYDLTDPALIAANERGEITAVQRSAVTTQVIASGCVVPVLLVFATTTGFIAVVAWSSFGTAHAFIPALFFAVFAFAFFGLIVPPVVRFVVTITKARRDLRENRVTEATGQIVWRKKRYQAEINGRPHGLLNQISSRSRNTDLSPGYYRFFLFPRSGLIISAVPLPGMADQTDQQAVLSQAFGFTPDELLANMRGEISSAQRASMRGGSIVPFLFGTVFIVAGIVPVVASLQNIGGALVFALIFCGVGALFVYNSLTTIAESRNGKPAMVEGPVRKEARQSSKAGTNYYCHIGNKQFSVQRIEYDAVLAERLYRVYYAPRSNTLLSIVHLSEEGNTNSVINK